MCVLDIELDYFNRHRKEWFDHHVGKFALIKGTTVHDFYDTDDNAYEAGVQLWGNVPFLIKEVQLEDEIVFSPWFLFLIRKV